MNLVLILKCIISGSHLRDGEAICDLLVEKNKLKISKYARCPMCGSYARLVCAARMCGSYMRLVRCCFWICVLQNYSSEIPSGYQLIYHFFHAEYQEMLNKLRTCRQQ